MTIITGKFHLYKLLIENRLYAILLRSRRCILYGFPCEMDFSHHESLNPPSRLWTRVGFGDKWWEIHLTWKTMQNAFSRILYISMHFNHAKYNVQSWRSWKPSEMNLSHNCSLHWRKSEVCKNIKYLIPEYLYLMLTTKLLAYFWLPPM